MATVDSNAHEKCTQCTADFECRSCQFNRLMGFASRSIATGNTYMPGYVYLLGSPHIQFHKIGYAANPAGRVSSIGIPGLEVRYSFYTQHMEVHETLFHALYGKKRVQREWFDLSESDVEEFKAFAHIVEHNGMPDEYPTWREKEAEAEYQRQLENAQREAESRQYWRDVKSGKRKHIPRKRRCINCQQMFVPKESHYECCSWYCYNDDSTPYEDPDNIEAIIDAEYSALAHTGSASVRSSIEIEHSIFRLEYAESQLYDLWEDMDNVMAYDVIYNRNIDVKPKRHKMYVARNRKR